MRKVVLIIVAIVVVVGLYELRVISPRAGYGRPWGKVGSVAPRVLHAGLSMASRSSLASYRQSRAARFLGDLVRSLPLGDSALRGVPEQYAAQGFQVVGISMDDGPEPVRKFYQEFKMNYPVGMGTTQLAESYGGILGVARDISHRPRRPHRRQVCRPDRTGTIQQKVESLLAKK